MSLNFIIIGAQKAATSFVHDCLREHPSVQMAIDEIPSFESPDYEHGGKESILYSYSAPQGMICGIKRPSYLGKPEVLDRIQALCPGAKLILVLRNPVDRAVSAYFHYIKHRFIPCTDLSTGMERLLDGSLQKSHPAAKDILEYGFYGRHLRTYLDRFPKVQILVLFHEDIVADGKQAIRRVYRFLGIDPEYQPESIDSRPQAVLFQPFRIRVARLVSRLLFQHSADHQRIIAKQGNPVSRLVARALRKIDRKILAPILKNTRPVLPESLRESLVEAYRQDIEDLERILGRDLSAWKTSPKSRAKRSIRLAQRPAEPLSVALG
ncbi:MAG: sulfotransferase domain-containing protein [Fibrobacteria bacterium]